MTINEQVMGQFEEGYRRHLPYDLKQFGHKRLWMAGSGLGRGWDFISSLVNRWRRR